MTIHKHKHVHLLIFSVIVLQCARGCSEVGEPCSCEYDDENDKLQEGESLWLQPEEEFDQPGQVVNIRLIFKLLQMVFFHVHPSIENILDSFNVCVEANHFLHLKYL